MFRVAVIVVLLGASSCPASSIAHPLTAIGVVSVKIASLKNLHYEGKGRFAATLYDSGGCWSADTNYKYVPCELRGEVELYEGLAVPLGFPLASIDFVVRVSVTTYGRPTSFSRRIVFVVPGFRCLYPLSGRNLPVYMPGRYQEHFVARTTGSAYTIDNPQREIDILWYSPDQGLTLQCKERP